MRDFKILTDSCCDIPDKLLLENKIDFMPFYTCVDGKNYLKERVDISVDDFYQKILDDKNLFAKTSFPALDEFMDFFRFYLRQDLDILYISMTSKFSGVYSGLLGIRDDLKKEFPDANIFFLDSSQISMGQGLLVLEACEAKKSGCNIFETVKFIEETKLETKLFFTVDSLKYLQKGGRIGKVSAIAGDFFFFFPIITMQNGELFPYKKVHGRKKAIDELMKLILEIKPKENYEFAVMHSCAEQEAKEIIETLKKNGIKIKFEPIKVGIIIGSHIGPSVLAFACTKKFNKN